uniref:Beta-glucuronidase n=1 Tax=Acrobeloides nanus TaxID=290746 RepID=A0A914EDJ4_9BILA
MFRCLFLILLILVFENDGILFPQRNEYRHYDQLDGLWTFVREPKNSYGVGLENKWHLVDLEDFKNATVMPVPSAYNDITQDINVRDHVGWVWYQYKFYASKQDTEYRTFLRFSSVNYYALIFFNGYLIGNHVGGHLPFQFEVSLNFNSLNKITIAVNNTLSHDTIPPGEFKYLHQTYPSGIQVYPPGFFELTPDFDFFNYAGILRSVYLLKLPKSYIKELKIAAYGNGNFSYRINVDTNNSGDLNADIVVTSLKSRQRVYEGKGLQADVNIQHVELWNPRGYGEPNLHELEIHLINNQTNQIIDIYREKFGFRTVQVTNDTILINEKTFYCKGFGMHEDFELHGRGYNPVVMTKDLNMVEWMGGNCYRTSHYPYSEERAYEADRRGIAVITEVPAVGMRYFTKPIQKLHAQMISEMILRDRNHPSVFAWSLSNEPASDSSTARNYYSDLITLTHSLDSTRPVTMVLDTYYSTDKVADMLDFICVNRYYGWYANTGYLETITKSYIGEIYEWKRKFQKPIIQSEYGADAIAGLSQDPSIDFSEQYQVDVLIRAHKAFDFLRANGSLAGEMVWNLADFMTAQSTSRAVGNHKGMLTRTRQPKMAAYVLKKRYETLENVVIGKDKKNKP